MLTAGGIIPGYGCNRSREHLLLFLLIFLVSLMVTGAAKEPRTCVDLEEQFDRLGFLPPKLRFDYCALGCDFIGKCNAESDDETDLLDVFYAFFDQIKANVKSAVEGNITAHWFAEEDVPIVTDEVMGAWKLLWKRLLPVSLSMLPILANQWKAYSYYWAVGFSVLFICVHGFGLMSMDIAAHNVVVSLACLMVPANSSALTELAGPTVLLVVVMFGTFFSNAYIQLLLVVIVAAIDASYIYELFYKKRAGGQATIVILIAQVYVLIEQQRFIREQFALRNFASACFEMFLNSVLPCGRSHSWAKNAGALAFLAVSKTKFSVDKVFEFVFFFLLQGVMILAFRAALGTFLINAMRYDFTADNVVRGLGVYMLDLFGPVQYLGRVALRLEKSNYRRTSYAVVCLTMTFFEAHHAVELFLLRLAVSSLDQLVFHSTYGRMTKYLGMHVDFSGRPFPQDGAKAWVSLDNVWHVGLGVRRIVADKAGKTVKGLGLVRGKEGKQQVLTAKHVIQGADIIDVHPDERSFGCGGFKRLGDNDDDPVVALDVEGLENAADLDLLVEQEVDMVDDLYVLGLDDDGERMITCVPRFTFRPGGELRCSVNLKPGDSGGPVVAVLKSGVLRYVGCVSKGAFDQGAGNIVSVVFHSETANASDEEVEIGDVARFNRKRDIAKVLSLRLDKFNDLVREIAGTFGSDPGPPSDDEKSLDGGQRKDDDDDGVKRKERRNARKKWKDRAADKRRILIEKACDEAVHLYNKFEMVELRMRLAEGPIVIPGGGMWCPKPGVDFFDDNVDYHQLERSLLLTGSISGGF